ncbi:prepilin-type N-terminal cleavage/methylation domain-containing protein [uncultured Psychrobacillus sp.]|uniref:type IV pilus modification PilV family protein n=1 Tax=uncultured Psychrobacillus sp. TaxID=1551585 RepID=UPI002630ED7B|nr:prepilin-type N-terminal cleavage/methylation domain-containing protein [uncultured Psychrobacillus sp.]
MSFNKIIKNQEGLSLVELLVAIIIITIILMAFLTYFLQSAKTGKSSEKIVDATYVAQTEMERFYELSLRINNSDKLLGIANLGYTPSSSNNEVQETFIKNHSASNEIIEVKIKPHSNLNGLYHIVIEIYDYKDGPLRVKMENVIEWR